jgi:hypothetical protein
MGHINLFLTHLGNPLLSQVRPWMDTKMRYMPYASP